MLVVVVMSVGDVTSVGGAVFVEIEVVFVEKGVCYCVHWEESGVVFVKAEVIGKEDVAISVRREDVIETCSVGCV